MIDQIEKAEIAEEERQGAPGWPNSAPPHEQAEGNNKKTDHSRSAWLHRQKNLS